jgi:hypothetical protein
MNLATQLFSYIREIIKFLNRSPILRAILLLSLLYLARIIALNTSGFEFGPTLCIFRNITGQPCPFCGTTRSVGNLLIGNYKSAFHLNPLGFLSVGFIGVIFISPLSVKKLNTNIAKTWWALNHKTQLFFLFTLFAIMWIMNFPRLGLLN